MKCLVTICSKNKNESIEPLPAHLRYFAPHIGYTYQKAKELKLYDVNMDGILE